MWPARLPTPLWAGHKEGVNRSVLREVWWASSWWPLAFLLWWDLGLVRAGSRGPLQGLLTRRSTTQTGLSWTSMMLPLGPVPRLGPGCRDCTGWRNVEPVLWEPESKCGGGGHARVGTVFIDGPGVSFLLETLLGRRQATSHSCLCWLIHLMDLMGCQVERGRCRGVRARSYRSGGARKGWRKEGRRGESHLVGVNRGQRKEEKQESRGPQQRTEVGARRALGCQHAARCPRWGAGRPQVSGPGGGSPTTNRAQEPA